ncbi:MAG: ATP synthase F1 subunit delta [Acidobacteriota bacterium]
MTRKTAGTRYARALFDVALVEADVQQVGRELAAFARMVAGHEMLTRVLANPAIPVPQKRAVVTQLLERSGPVTPVVGKLLLLLANGDRLVLLPELAAAYENRLREHARVVRAELITAFPLPDDRVAALQDGLQRATGRSVVIDTRVDPSIIGGAIAKIGSTVYDGSVTRQLQKMKDALVAAAAS